MSSQRRLGPLAARRTVESDPSLRWDDRLW